MIYTSISILCRLSRALVDPFQRKVGAPKMPETTAAKFMPKPKNSSCSWLFSSSNLTHFLQRFGSLKAPKRSKPRRSRAAEA